MVMKHLKYIALILFVWLGAACEQLPLPNTELTIKSEIVTEVTANSAVIEVEFNPTAATIQNVYACYTSTEKTVMEKVSDLKYRVNLLALDNNTEYHVHYMVTNSFSSVTLQNNLSFTTAVNKPSNVIDTVYHIDFTQTMGAWTIKNYLLSEGLTYVWARSDKYGMKATSYNAGNLASEAWLISSPLDLTSNTTAFLTFNQAYKYGDISQFAVKITKNGLDWTTLEVPTWPDGTSWDFINSGEIDITKYISATTQIAFAYTSSAEASPTWEIKDVLIKGNGTRIEEPTASVTPEYVDLGLSVMWATFNVGAIKPEGYGDYFAWGEVEPKEVYDWSTYKWCNGSESTLTKYCTDSYYGTIDNKTVLEAADDVAAVKWGSTWRMPTDAELLELHTECIWTWTTLNGVDGYKVTGTNGNSIFLPAAGYCGDSSFYGVGIHGYYWSNSLDTNGPRYAWRVNFHSSNVGRRSNRRDYGYSVRPVYGPQSEQTTAPTVVTSAVTQITETSAVVGGNVTSDGGASVTERGVVYSTNPNPVITNLSNTILPCGSGAGSFTCNLTGLQPNTTYYIRAYAKNDAGTAYGEEMSFTTQTQIEKPTSPYFSVSQTKYITFSPGNLQYTQSTNTWSFAENQWDMIGTDNVTDGSESLNSKDGYCKEGTALADKIDLFGWSTSATNFGVSTSTDYYDYSGGFVDWGTNKIGNDAPNTWRTLSKDEWEYLLNTRTNANSLKGVAQVNGVNGLILLRVNGLILLPDNWTCPSGVTFKSGFHSEESVEAYGQYQAFSADQWSKLEDAGAVFLSAAGYRYGSDVGSVQVDGIYWSATEYDSSSAYHLYFYSDGAGMYDNIRDSGLSVRLVKDL